MKSPNKKAPKRDRLQKGSKTKSPNKKVPKCDRLQKGPGSFVEAFRPMLGPSWGYVGAFLGLQGIFLGNNPTRCFSCLPLCVHSKLQAFVHA